MKPVISNGNVYKKTLPKIEIIKGFEKFKNVIFKSRKISTENFKVYLNLELLKDCPPDFPVKVGFLISKKHFKLAVKRNYLKRILKELYRKNKSLLEIPTGYQVNLVFTFSDLALENEKRYSNLNYTDSIIEFTDLMREINKFLKK
ncbi:MAG TPA: ribonuclease P protein component [Ignavibacteria bacterium]|nr:ribonuclease P protein component [Ignavibacteria bacterium]